MTFGNSILNDILKNALARSTPVGNHCFNISFPYGNETSMDKVTNTVCFQR